MSSTSYNPHATPPYKRPPAHETWLKVAFALAEQGTCIRRGCGCVILDGHGQVMSTGWNGVASKDVHCIDTPCPGADAASGSSLGECQAIHAEENALQQCKDVWAARTMYVTASPCLDRCLRKIMNTGIMTIVFAYGYHDPDEVAKRRWESSLPGRKWLQVDVPEHTWQPLVMRPYDLPDGLYYTNDVDMGMVQVNGSQVYKGNAVQEFTHPVLCQRVQTATYERRVVGDMHARAKAATAPIRLDQTKLKAYAEAEAVKDQQQQKVGLGEEQLKALQAASDARPRVFNADPNARADAKMLVQTGVNAITGLRDPHHFARAYPSPQVKFDMVQNGSTEVAAMHSEPTHVNVMDAPVDAQRVTATSVNKAIPVADVDLSKLTPPLHERFVTPRDGTYAYPDTANHVRSSNGTAVVLWPNSLGSQMLADVPVTIYGQPMNIMLYTGIHPTEWAKFLDVSKIELVDHLIICAALYVDTGNIEHVLFGEINKALGPFSPKLGLPYYVKRFDPVPERTESLTHTDDILLTYSRQQVEKELSKFMRSDARVQGDASVEWVQTSVGNFVTSWPNASGSCQLMEAPVIYEGQNMLVKLFGPSPLIWQGMNEVEKHSMANAALERALSFVQRMDAELLVLPNVFHDTTTSETKLIDKPVQSVPVDLAVPTAQAVPVDQDADLFVQLPESTRPWPTITKNQAGGLVFIVDVDCGSTVEKVTVQGPSVAQWRSMLPNQKIDVMHKVMGIADNSMKVEADHVLAPEHPAASNG